MKRILLIANKVWEVQPLLNALLNARFQPDPGKPFFPEQLVSPWRDVYGNPPRPRAEYTFKTCTVEIWCIQDHMDPAREGSSSEEKNRIMPAFFSYRDSAPALVIAFGTASSAPGTTCNGSVVVGSNVFIHDGHPQSDPNPDSEWRSTAFGKLLKSTVPETLFQALGTAFTGHNNKLLNVPVLPAAPCLDCRLEYIAVSTVNVTNYKEYADKDAQTMKALKAAGIKEPVGSVETTHGVIRAQSDAPFMFVSGIPNRFGEFGVDMKTQPEAQNYVAGFNAGVVVGYLLPVLDKMSA